MTSCGSGCDGPSLYYVGDVGTEIIVDVCSDISTATLATLKVMKPDGTLATWVGSVYNTQYVRYITVAGDFDQIGEYRVQPYIEMPGFAGRGDTARFKVSATFQ